MDDLFEFMDWIDKNDIARKAQIFDTENPHVYELFCKYAKEAHKAGHSKYSSKGIFEIIRWDKLVKTSNDNFKLCNNYTPYYARKFMAFNPSFKGFFETR